MIKSNSEEQRRGRGTENLKKSLNVIHSGTVSRASSHFRHYQNTRERFIAAVGTRSQRRNSAYVHTAESSRVFDFDISPWIGGQIEIGKSVCD